MKKLSEKADGYRGGVRKSTISDGLAWEWWWKKMVKKKGHGHGG